MDHSTFNRWILAYAPLIERRLRSFRKPHCGSVRIDETYIKIRGQWRYLYRAIEKHGTPVDFLLTAKRDLDAAKRFFRKMLQDQPLLSPIGSARMPLAPTRPPSEQRGEPAFSFALRCTMSPSTCSRGSKATTSGSREPCRGWAASSPSRQPDAPFRASRPCSGCARASASPVRGPSASRTSCSRSASDFRRLTKHENEAAHPAA